MGYILKMGTKIPTIGGNVLVNRNKLSLQSIGVSGFSGPVGIALDVANNRYYVTNSSANTVRIMNYTTNAEIALISGFNSPRFIALDIANNRYYVCNYGANTVRIDTYNYI